MLPYRRRRILLPHLGCGRIQIERFIQKMQQDIAILNNKNIIPTEVGIACGYALATPDDADIEKVRERADEMMYHNKKVLKGLI